MSQELIELITTDAIFKKTSAELNYNSYRNITFQRLASIINRKIINVFDVLENPDTFFNVMNILHAYDISLAVKTGVNFGLFGVSLQRLGFPEQVKDILNLLNIGQIFGCLAITEIGHGSNLKALETIAVWDNMIDSFVLNSPTQSSIKCWIGNAACHATHSIVFAQLIYNKQNLGLHPFLVQLRNIKGIVYGITITDNGFKKGLNGVDNGMIKFENVIVPRQNLLARFGYIDHHGKYVPSHEDAGKRFGELLSTLSGGRGVLASGAIVVSMKSLAVACKYSQMRKQFSGKDLIERPIMNYTTHQLLLIPLICKSVVLRNALEKFRIDGIREFKETSKISKKLHALTSGLKIIGSEHAEKCCRVARLACGGHGYAWENELGKMHNDIDIYQTFEGDNTLLRQEVTKYKLMELKDLIGTSKLTQMLYFIKIKLNEKLLAMNNFIFGYGDIKNPITILKLLKYKEVISSIELINKLVELTNNDIEGFDAWNCCLDLVMDVANSYLNRKIFDINITQQTNIDVLVLFGLELLHEDMKWYLIRSVIDKNIGNDIIQERKNYCMILHNMIDNLIDSFNIHSIFMNIPILKIVSKL
ncbi:peroxisomal acyl-CoA oxidase [Fadolivirus algeromassiliense]|jgi:acyl-CoA oxidase|uniref:acyl-CoA oxidase n=1 Tax=Fadolivirus FV1/VV64 TaxID=3070911 RepID=A0A7D3UUW7_9VIRU|nr:peroxisomal acyl-CoA oxidase [Fadolivirus algeromassiliense]QKF93534.1 peroxisomal acyl-CoA oxidase [Fadolivirus FV1/VV64]